MFSRQNSNIGDSKSSLRGGSLVSRNMSEPEVARKELARKGSGLSRKVSDAALYGFNRPQEMEEMKPEKEPLIIEDETIPSGLYLVLHTSLLEVSSFVCFTMKIFLPFTIFIFLEMMSAMTPLLDLSRNILWHWKTFPIILPPPITLQADQNQGLHVANRYKYFSDV